MWGNPALTLNWQSLAINSENSQKNDKCAATSIKIEGVNRIVSPPQAEAEEEGGDKP